MLMEELDVLIIGAGISGIGAAVHLQERCKTKTFAILERRANVGGTWDLFRYPGVRSDSDMYTLGFRFKPWTHPKAIADGPTIREYLNETVGEHGLLKKIRFDHQVVSASWSSGDAKWTVSLRVGLDQTSSTIRCSFLFMCGGYYNYDEGYTPNFVGQEDFAGTILHPQHWPENFEYSGKRVIVIGSGATAVTLVPAMLRDDPRSGPAAHVVMLQRSPTYMVSRPSEDKIALKLRRILPSRAAYMATRWKNVLLGGFFFKLARQKPDKIKGKILEGVRAELGPNYDIDTNFTPTYNPWDQRLCLVPDSDIFKAIRSGNASVVTGHIDRFTEHGIMMTSGAEIAADIVVTATGLNLQMLAGVTLTVDGNVIDVSDTVLHKGILLSGIPNLAMWFGYTNASWTLKADLTSEYICRMLNLMDANKTPIVCAEFAGNEGDKEQFVDFSSGYFQRAKHLLPKQGMELPWKLNQNYLKDVRLLRRGKVDDAGLVFSRPT